MRLNGFWFRLLAVGIVGFWFLLLKPAEAAPPGPGWTEKPLVWSVADNAWLLQTDPGVGVWIEDATSFNCTGGVVDSPAGLSVYHYPNGAPWGGIYWTYSPFIGYCQEPWSPVAVPQDAPELFKAWVGGTVALTPPGTGGGGGTGGSTAVTVTLAKPSDSELVQASLIMFGLGLGFLASLWALRKVYETLNHGRNE